MKISKLRGGGGGGRGALMTLEKAGTLKCIQIKENTKIRDIDTTEVVFF
jgi:hypothetical protein